ncbi:MAG TPA: GyrI-like domain-containing protein [Oculatellaceae cyanobacterium]
MSLNENYDTITFPATHYVYIEKVGPFMENAPKAWQEVLKVVPELAKLGAMKQGMSLYKVGPQIYRAGFCFDAKPDNIPSGLEYMHFDGGRYARFVLTGSYSQMPEACGRVFEIVATKKLKTEERFNIEHYVNDPKSTPEDKLITEILVPIS